MADLIDAANAKQLLGCDDATLQNFINNGTIRAQRVSGQLMLNRDDVQNLAQTGASDSDDGTIILSGDSEDLSIDLGEVVDDSAATIVQSNQDSDGGGDSITFGDDLEVVNFDDSHTEDLQFDDNAGTEDLSFTDSNTAVVTDVDETVIGTGTATATSDFQTVDYGDDDQALATGASGRRSVRSQRVRQAPVKVHWFWPTTLVLTVLVVVLLGVPYVFMLLAAKEGTYYNKSPRRGAADNIWTDLAQGLAGFSPEPDPQKYAATHPDGQHLPVSAIGLPDDWRYKQYRAKWDAEKRPLTFRITDIEFDDAAEGKPKAVRASSRDDNGNILITFPVTVTDDVEAPNPKWE